MTFDFKAEVDRADFLDFIDNNIEEIKRYLLLEHEDILLNIYNNKDLIK